MTRYNTEITRGQFNNYSIRGERPDGTPLWNPAKIKTIEYTLRKFGKKPNVFTTRGLLSLILPDDLYYECKNDKHPNEPIVKIHSGVIIEGAFDKTIIGGSHKSLIQVIHKEYGVEFAANFIDNIQFVTSGWLATSGFTVSLEDCMITSEENITSIKSTLTECYTKAQGIEEGTINPGIREVRVTGALSQAKDIGMRIAKGAMKKTNNLLATVDSGAKGDYFNIAQITGLLGQQNLEGERVPKTLNHGKRTLPHYPFGEMEKEREYESRGFIADSFIRGLRPESYFFHAMSGREGICDTATRTADSGYVQRRIVKACEDIQVQYDGTVRDATKKIYQFSYDGTNLDPTKTVKVRGKQQVCDIGRLADRLNKTYEVKSTQIEPIARAECEREQSESSETEYSDSDTDTERIRVQVPKMDEFSEIEDVY